MLVFHPRGGVRYVKTKKPPNSMTLPSPPTIVGQSPPWAEHLILSTDQGFGEGLGSVAERGTKKPLGDMRAAGRGFCERDCSGGVGFVQDFSGLVLGGYGISSTQLASLNLWREMGPTPNHLLSLGM